ncbi:portal protein, partial [Acinetobacter baumannii]
MQQTTAVRFTPEQIVHMRIGDDRKTFYPYGVSLVEAARGPAHQLRLMEDAMVVYRLTRAPERR